jgi:hypothetical protein
VCNEEHRVTLLKEPVLGIIIGPYSFNGCTGKVAERECVRDYIRSFETENIVEISFQIRAYIKWLSLNLRSEAYCTLLPLFWRPTLMN